MKNILKCFCIFLVLLLNSTLSFAQTKVNASDIINKIDMADTPH